MVKTAVSEGIQWLKVMFVIFILGGDVDGKPKTSLDKLGHGL